MVVVNHTELFKEENPDVLAEFEEASEDGIMIPDLALSESDSWTEDDESTTDNIDVDSDEWAEIVADLDAGDPIDADDDIFSRLIETIDSQPRNLHDIEEAWANIPKIFKSNVIENFSSENYCKIYVLILNMRNHNDRPITDDFGRWAVRVNFENVPKIWPVLKGYSVSSKSLVGHCDRLFEEMRDAGFDFEDSREMLQYLATNKHIMDCYAEVATWRSLLCEWSDAEPWCKCKHCCICGFENPKFSEFVRPESAEIGVCTCFDEWDGDSEDEDDDIFA